MANNIFTIKDLRSVEKCIQFQETVKRANLILAT